MGWWWPLVVLVSAVLVVVLTRLLIVALMVRKINGRIDAYLSNKTQERLHSLDQAARVANTQRALRR